MREIKVNSWRQDERKIYLPLMNTLIFFGLLFFACFIQENIFFAVFASVFAIFNFIMCAVIIIRRDIKFNLERCMKK